MTLDPDYYECPEHHRDLTYLVEEKLEDEGPPVAYWRLPRSEHPKVKPFQVIVTCPGEDGTSSHVLTCTGSMTQ